MVDRQIHLRSAGVSLGFDLRTTRHTHRRPHAHQEPYPRHPPSPPAHSAGEGTVFRSRAALALAGKPGEYGCFHVWKPALKTDAIDP